MILCALMLIIVATSSDYVSASVLVVFPAGSSNGAVRCVDVTIIDDSETEGVETFSVRLSSSSPIVTLANTVTNITIIDTGGYIQ